MNQKRFAKHLLLSMLLSVVPSLSTKAQTISWTNSNGGWWENGSNWAGGVAPGAAQTASFSQNATYFVNWDGATGNTTTSNLDVLGGNVTFQSGGGIWSHTVTRQLNVAGGGILNVGGTSAATRFNMNTDTLIAANLKIRSGSRINANDVALSSGITEITGGSSLNSTGRLIFSSGTVIVSGTGSRWDNASGLTVGSTGVGILSIQNGGTVSIGGTTSIGLDDSVTLSGGRFEFGTTSLDNFQRIGGSSGLLAGQVNSSGFTNLSSLTPLQSSILDISEVNVRNSGTLIGTGSLLTGFTNTTTGRIDASTNSVMRFEGDNNLNQGRINSTGGMVSMAGKLTNSSTGQITNLGGQIVTLDQLFNQGFVSGRGEFTAGGGIVNTGSMAFSGTADVFGNVNNTGLIVTSANATTTFYNSMINNGEIRTSGNGNSVFFEVVSGSGSYTGTGNVFFEGNVNPGNSPAVVEFGGNLTLGTGSNTLFELGGLSLGQYDRINVAGNLNILGSMSVQMWNGFQLSSGMNFLIADIGGNRTGTFTGLGEGALVGNFGGTDLFITYAAGNGNDIGLFTAVPEPGSCLMLSTAALAVAARRFRRKPSTRESKAKQNTMSI